MKIKSYFVKIKENIAKLYNKNKKLFFSIIALVVVIVGYLFFSFGEKENKNEQLIEDEVQSQDLSSYEDFLEKKLETILLEIDEVTSADVMVVCDSSYVYHYLKNVSVTESGASENGTKTITEEVVFEKEGSNSKPVLEKFDMPKVVGVMVVVSGVSPSTKLSIINSISVVLNVSTECISIVVD